MQFEKKYWSKGEFTNSKGDEFNGYVGILDGEAYNYKTYEKLIGKDTYLARINCSKKNFDRTLSQRLQLPYNRQDVVFAANDFLYAGVVKTAVERLQENNDYLFRNSIISSSNLPVTDECILLSSAVNSNGELKNIGPVLGKYNFSSYVFNSKTQKDRNFYPDTETHYKYYVKTKNGLKEEKTSSNVSFINGERVPSNRILSDEEKKNEDSIASLWKELYNNGETPKVLNDGTTLDDEGIVQNTEYMYYNNLQNIEKNSDNLTKRLYSYNTLKGIKKTLDITSDSLYTLTINSSILSNDSNYTLKELSFIIKSDSIEDIGLSVENGSTVSPSHYFNIDDNFYHVIYILDKSLNSKTISISFNKNITLIGENGIIRFDSQFEFGTIDNTIKNWKTISNVTRNPRYRYVWTTNDNVTKYSGLNWSYKYLTESEEWVKAIKDNKNPRLVVSNVGRVEDFIPSDTMTGYDIYTLACERYGEYNFPQIYREVKYEYKGEITNSEYKEKKYPVESYDFEGDEVIHGFKSAKDVYNDLEIEGEKEKYDKIPNIIKEGFTVTIGEDDLVCNFNDITSSEIIVHKVDSSKKSAEIIVFLVAKTKLIIFKTKYYFKNISEGDKSSSQNFVISKDDYNSSEFLINLAKNSSDAIHIENIDPHDESSLKFLNLNAIKVYKNAMYLIDSKLDMILRYDIEALMNEEEANTNNWFNIKSIKLLDIMQGLGDSQDKIYFNNPYSIDVNDDCAYIVDRNNNCIKEYSPSLNYVKTLKNGYFASQDIQACAINPHSCIIDGIEIAANSLWIASVMGTRIFLSVLEKDIVKFYGQIEDISLIQDTNSWVEEVRSIKFSQTHSNYFYLNTSKRIYKLHVSNPLYPFASLSYFKQRSIIGTMKWSAMRYPWNKIPSIYGAIAKDSETNINNEVTWDYLPPTSSAEILDNKCFSLTSSPEIEGDIIFHFGVLYDDSKIKEFIRKNKQNYENKTMTFNDIPLGDLATMIKSSAILLYQEPDSFVTTISNELIKIYEIYQVKESIENDYINTLSFNKMLHSLIYNLLKIKNNLIGHFRAATNLDNVIVYDNVIIDEYFKNLKLNADEDYYVHSNEHLSIIVNKVFENIYNIQEKILSRMQTEFMAAQSYVNNSSRLI